VSLEKVGVEMGQVVRGLVIESLSRIAEAIRRASVGGVSVAFRSVSRLDDVLWVREPVEDSGEFTATLMEYSSKPLIARRPYRDGIEVTPVGVDSSSRHLETPIADIVIGGAAALSSSGLNLLEWPPLGAQPRAGSVHPVFYLLPNTASLFELSDPLVSTFNPAGRPFDINYSVSEACDEMRVSLENWVLQVIAESIVGVKSPVVMIDGPLYVVAKALTREAPQWLRDVWVKLLLDRVRAIKELEAKNIPVLGVVKRVEKSTILSKTRGLEHLGGGVVEGDKGFILRLFAALHEKIPGRIYATPKILVRVSNVPEVGVLDKVIQYIVIPPGKYQQSVELARVYRLEYTLKTVELLEEYGLKPEVVIGFDSVARGALEPLSIRLSDWRSSYTTQAFKRMLSMSIISAGGSLGYWSLREVEMSWRK